jgi:hypothetical protein
MKKILGLLTLAFVLSVVVGCAGETKPSGPATKPGTGTGAAPTTKAP